MQLVTGNSLGLCLLCWVLGAVVPVSGQGTGFYYNGNGGTGGSASTCSKIACSFNSCTAGKKLSGCTGGSPGSCVACTNTIPAGQRYSPTFPAPNADGNCPLVACTPCAAGFYNVGCGGGDGTSDGTCTACPAGSLGATKYWGPNADATSNCPQLDRKVCTSGFYTTGSSTTAEGICTACTGLTAKNYWVAPTIWSYTCTQAAQTKCPDGQRNSVVTTPQTTSAGTCSACPALTNNGLYYGPNVDSTSNCPTVACSDSACSVGQYIKDCGTVSPFTSPGTCSACTGTITSTQVYSTKGSWNDNCAVSGCPTTGCILGQYVTGCGGPPSALGCANCANAVAGSTFYSGIGYNSTCGLSNCRTCSNGQYTKGCTVLVDGTCDACTN